MRPPEGLRAEIRARVFPSHPTGEAHTLARRLVAAGGDSVRGVVFFGSRKSGAAPGPGSAHDFFVAVRDYPGFYRALAAAGALRRRAGLVAALNRVLAPNVISLREGGAQAKCAVLSLEHLERETSARRRDHFVMGRLFQPTEVLYAADEAAGASILDALAGAHFLTLAWVRPWLPPRFDVAAYCRTLLRVSFGWEIRPEPAGRTETLWEAQQAYLKPVYGVVLRELAARGELRELEPGIYALPGRATAAERARLALYFQWSLVRATARWAKYIVTFDDWLDFIVRKARRHTDQEIVLTSRERRYPLIFLWPRLIHYLRHKNQR